jgi:hypothetical protein
MKFLLFTSLLIITIVQISAQDYKSISVGGYSTTIKDKRLALVIGNNEYSEISKLSNPIKDAKAIKTALEACGFDVIIHENGTKKSIKEKVREFSEKLKSYDVGMFYYSGHGIEVNGVNYIAPVDIVSEASANDIVEECVATEFILSKMGEAGRTNKTYIMVLDACRNNPFKNIFKDFGSQTWKAPSVVPSGSITCFAASQGEKAIEGKELSPYTELFLKHMKSPGLKIEDVFKRVRIDLEELKINNPQLTQEPVEMNKLTTNFYFVPSKDEITIKPQTDPEVKITDLATLKILSTVNGTIKIDGELKGSIKENEIKIFKLEPGEYFVQLFTEKDNIPFDEEITLSAAKTETIKFDVKITSQNNPKKEPDILKTNNEEKNKLVINIDGKNLEVYPKKLGEMKWQDAEKLCEKLGAGWRLPNHVEYVAMMELLRRNGKWEIKSDWYFEQYGYLILLFPDGRYFLGGNHSENPYKRAKAYVRPVRDL